MTSTSWFHDPLTVVQRAALVPVPARPRSVHGPLQRTRALWKSHSGALAVPAITAVGHQLSRGQAVTLSRRNLFVAGSAQPTMATRARVATLAVSLAKVTAVTCEGYTDYGGNVAREGRLATKRAARVCSLLAAAHPGLVTTTHGYGRRVPVVVGGRQAQRAANRRIVVLATGVVRPATPPVIPTPPQQATAPGAPTLSSVLGGVHTATLTFAAPTSDGGSPITGYQWSTDQTTWHPMTTTGTSPYTVQLTSLLAGTATYYVRAVNAIGNGPASGGSAATVTDPVLPNAPTVAQVIYSCGQLYTWFYPGTANAATVTGYEFSLDGGATWTTAQNVVNPTSIPSETQRRFNNTIGGCSLSFGTQLIMRATSTDGPSAASAPYTVLIGP